MTVHSKLNLSDKTKAAMLASPEAKLRGKMLEAPDLQIEAAQALYQRSLVMTHRDRAGDPIQSACGAACV